jgi:hypothetical protein
MKCLTLRKGGCRVDGVSAAALTVFCAAEQRVFSSPFSAEIGRPSSIVVVTSLREKASNSSAKRRVGKIARSQAGF